MEVLKQGRNAPVDVAHQVCVFYAVINGYLKDVPVASIKDFEMELYTHMDDHCYEVLQNIRTTGQLSKEDEETLKQTLNVFTGQFLNLK